MASAITVSPSIPTEISAKSWQEAGWLPCLVTAEIPARAFTFGDLLNITVGSVLDTRVAIESEVFLCVNGTRVGSGNLDAVGKRFGIRITDLG